MLVLTTLTGDDALVAPRLRELTQRFGPGVESLDLEQDDLSRLVDVVASGSLFATTRYAVVRNLTPEALDVLETYRDASSAEILLTSKLRMTAKLVARVEALGALERLSIPDKPKDRAALVTSLAVARGITLQSTDALFLAERLAENFERLSSILTQLELAGITSPTSRQVATLAGSTAPEVTPWSITDAAAKGDVASVLSLTAQSDPIFVSSFLVAETLRLVQVKEQKLSEAQVAKLLAIHPFRAKKLVSWAARVPLESLHRAVLAAARVDLAAKSDQPADRLLLAVATWLDEVRPR